MRRPQLVDRVLRQREPIVVLEAIAGMGKSTLLAEIAEHTGATVCFGPIAPLPAGDGPTLWDLGSSPASAALPECFGSGGDRLIIAKRPETEITGLSRAMAYRRAVVFGATDLRFAVGELTGSMSLARARRIVERTGGWPLLLPYHDRAVWDDDQLAEILDQEVLRRVPIETLAVLGEVLEGRRPANLSIPLLAPLVDLDETGHPIVAIEAIRAPLLKAYQSAIAHRSADETEVLSLSRALLQQGRTTEAITTLQRAGRYDAALEILTRAEGHFYIYRHGSAAFDAVLSGFPYDYALRHETLILCHALQSLKRGDVARARQLIGDHLGAAANRPAEVFGKPDAYSLAFRMFRVVMLIYEDFFITDDLLEQVFGLIGELPHDADLERGTFYNSLLEFYMRRRRFAEAEDVAVRAKQYYAAANVPMLQFYISLHRAVMRLLHADASEAQRFASEAAGNLAACGFESPNDARLLALLQACIEYEGGRAEPLARFLSVELDDFSHGEVWPTIIDLALLYGSQALSEHFSTIVARGFLDRWRVYQVHNRQFQTMIDIREATVLQNGNRWQESADRLALVDSRITRGWVLSASGELSRLQGRDEIALALAWLRQLVFEMPSRVELDGQLDEILANLQLTGRQRFSIEIWQAYLFRHRRELSRSRTTLLKTLERAARLGAHGPLAEERYFLVELIGNRRTHDFLHTFPHIRQVMRRLTDSGLVGRPLGARGGLSRRESKVLMMVSEGGSSKLIANALGVTEATVKYHLGNIYRKLGCRRRREAIDAARALGLVS